jgi:expansin (peptidoglycan-binding protein)
MIRPMLRMLWVVALAGVACGGSDDPTSGSGDDPGDDEEGAACEASASVSGQGTYYDADGTGACSFAASPGDLMVAALNAPDWDGSAMCGACADVTGPSGHVVVRIVDQCPECKHGDLDLSPQAFAKLSPLAAGRVAIQWHLVACDVSGPIDYHFKDGSNPYWTAVQIRNHRYPIAKIEARTGDGSWRALTRATYNYFIADPGLGAGPLALRVTDRMGHLVEDDQVPFAADKTAAGAAQLATCE